MVAKSAKKKYARKGKKAYKKKAVKGKKRMTFKKTAYKRGAYKKKAYKKKTYRRSVSAKLLESGRGDQAILFDYVDKPAFVNTTNAIAKQFVWASNTIATPAVTTGGAVNLMLDSGPHLEAMFVNVNTYAANSASGGLPFPPSGNKNVGATIRLLRKSAEVQCRITNCETSTVELWEYRICARRDQTILPGDMWYQAGQMESGAYIAANAVAGTAITPSALANGGYATPVGVTPYMLHAFVTQYKILKVKKRELQPGRSLKIKYSFKKPKQYNWANLCSTIGGPGGPYAAGSTGVPFVVRKGQCLSMFMAKGTIATNATANANYQVGISNVNLGMEYMYRYHYNYATSTQASATSQQSIPGFSSQSATTPLPMVANVPQLAISTGAAPAFAGTLVYQNAALTGASSTFDAIMTTV